MFERNVSLANYSNYKIGGPADFFCSPKNEEELAAVLREWHELVKIGQAKGDVFILGGGTNILFPDEGWRGLVIRPEFTSLRREEERLYAGAGVSMSDLLIFAAKEGLSGLEWAGGLPGTLGGAIRGNAGCFGGEIKDSILEVRSINYDGTRANKQVRAECEFDYRTSVFKKEGNEVITEAVLALSPGDPGAVRASSEEKINYRRERHPLEYPNIGSIFKNVPLAEIMAANHLTEAEARERLLVKDDPFPVVPTARLISECGLKGTKSGGAQISEKHANFIVNTGGAKASDVKALIELIKQKVSEKFHVIPEKEVLIL